MSDPSSEPRADVFVAFLPRSLRHVLEARDRVGELLDEARGERFRETFPHLAGLRRAPREFSRFCFEVPTPVAGSVDHYVLDHLGFLTLRSSTPLPVHVGLEQVRRVYFELVMMVGWKVVATDLLWQVDDTRYPGQDSGLPLMDAGLAAGIHGEVSAERAAGVEQLHLPKRSVAGKDTFLLFRDMLLAIPPDRADPKPVPLVNPRMADLLSERETNGLRFLDDQFTVPFLRCPAAGTGDDAWCEDDDLKILKILALNDFSDKTYDIFRHLMGDVRKAESEDHLAGLIRAGYEGVSRLTYRLEQCQHVWTETYDAVLDRLDRVARMEGSDIPKDLRVLPNAVRTNANFVLSQYRAGLQLYGSRHQHLRRLNEEAHRFILLGLTWLFAFQAILAILGPDALVRVVTGRSDLDDWFLVMVLLSALLLAGYFVAWKPWRLKNRFGIRRRRRSAGG